jgi:transposase
MTELLCVDRGVPIFGGTLDGNSSDKTSNNRMLSRIGSIMACHGLGPGAFVYVADSAMMTKDNLDAMGPNLFVSRLPANYSECARAISEAVDAQEWIHLGNLAEHPSTASRPCAEYKAFETSVVLHGKSYRAVVVHSSSHDKRRRKKLEKAVAESAKSLDRQLKTVQTVYFCEADALRAARETERLSTRLHTVAAAIAPVAVGKRGRPPKNAPPPTTTRYKLSWQLVENTEGIAREKALAGCFVLATNVPAAEGFLAMDVRRLLQTYKGQYGVESDFAFLKDPLVVNDIFLKKPARIEVLGMVLIIALMVWRLMERSMRSYVENSGVSLPGWDGRTTVRPTSFMMTTFMKGIKIIIIGKRRYLHRQLRPDQLAFLNALGLGPPVFTEPSCRCQPIICRKSV